MPVAEICHHVGVVPAALTVTLDPPAPPRLARALALLLDEINTTPPRMPGDQRPITYQLPAQPALV